MPADGDTLTTLGELFGELALQLADGADQPLITQRLVEISVRGIPGAEHASLTEFDPGRPPRTSACSDDAPGGWDQLQYEYGEGPCLELNTGTNVVWAPDLRTDSRWPRFSNALLEQTPVRSMLAYRLFLPEQKQAGLNLYASRPSAFDDQSVATGALLAAYASMALIAAARNDRANDLARALTTSREVGVALGILMANGRLTRQEAFRQLRAASNNLNRKLHDIADEVALSGRLPKTTPPRKRSHPRAE